MALGITLQVIDIGKRAELAEKLSVASGLGQVGNLARGIVQISEDHGLRRARLYAGWIEFAIF